MELFDYVIVGAGSAGCVLANRLSAEPGHRVLLVEAGGGNRSPLISMPKGIARLMDGRSHGWRFPVSQPRVEGESAREVWVRGRGLGGSSAINGMIYSRGHRLDYEDWAAVAGPEWGWESMRGAYVALEDHELGANDHRGAGGPLHVSAGSFRYPLAEAMIGAGEQMGLPRRDELNHPDLEGVGYYSHTIRNGRRLSAAGAFLTPARHRANLTVRTGVTIRRVVFDGLRAVGVSGLAGGRDIEVRARCAVILSAGTIMSPALLQRSGIGPAEYLRSAGVPVLYDSPAVGTGLQEHLALGMPYRLRGERGLNHRYRSIGLAPDLVRYGLTRTGPMATGPFEVGAFARVTKGADRPDVQLYLSAVSREAGTYRPERQPGFTIYGQLLRLTSRGSIRITSAHPEDLPYIEPNWLTTEADRRAAVDLVRYMRRYVQQDSLAPYVGEELAPGASYHDDKEILEVFRRMSTCGLHAVGTVPMGKEDAAVDERLRVRGVQGLRVVDCSVMPSLVSGNTSGPAMALSWRAADLILEDGAGA